MCGLFGMINGSPDKFMLLGAMNESRGNDSWGVFDFGLITKDTGTFRAGIVKNSRKAMQHRSILGHTRAATHGTVSYRNAHPFEYENIIAAHNGVVTNYYSSSRVLMDDEFSDDSYLKAIQVDSEVLVYILARHERERMKILEGYAALWWYDKRQPDYFFLWRDGGTLYYAKVGSKSLYFSSQKDHLEAIGAEKTEIVPLCEVLKINIKTAEIIKDGKMSLSMSRGTHARVWYGDFEDTYSHEIWDHKSGGWVRREYAEKVRERYDKYKDAYNKAAYIDDPESEANKSVAIVPASANREAAVWRAGYELSHKKQKRLIKTIESVRRHFKEGNLNTAQCKSTMTICGLPVRVGACAYCHIEWPWSIVTAHKPDMRCKDRAPCPQCYRTIESRECFWCPKCERIVPPSIVETDSLIEGDDEVLICPTCEENLEDIFSGVTPIVFEPVAIVKKESVSDEAPFGD